LALLFPEDQTHITTMHIAGTKWVRIYNFNLSFNNHFFSMQSSYINKVQHNLQGLWPKYGVDYCLLQVYDIIEIRMDVWVVEGVGLENRTIENTTPI
jgi:hypothetical protein